MSYLEDKPPQINTNYIEMKIVPNFNHWKNLLLLIEVTVLNEC